MINFRYHIVSITAVFLALGIGVALGGTFLDRATVDLLEGNIDRAETRIRDTEAKNTDLENRLNRSLQRESSLVEAGGRLLFSGLLRDLPIIVIAQPGIDPDLVESTVEALTTADADLRGVLTFEEALNDDDRIDIDLANAVSVPVDRPDEVRAAVLSAFRQELIDASLPIGDPSEDDDGDADGGSPTDGSNTSSTVAGDDDAGGPPDTNGLVDTGRPAILTALLEGGYLGFEPADGVDADTPLLEADVYRFLVLGSAEPTETENDLITALLPGNSGNAIAAVVAVAETPEPDEDAPTIVAALRDDPERDDVYSTIDDLDRFTGSTAAIITLRDLPMAEPHHYGQAAGAGAILPGDS